MHGDRVGDELAVIGRHVWLSVNSRATAALRTVKSTLGTGLGIPVSWNIAARYRSSRSNVIPLSAAMAAPHV